MYFLEHGGFFGGCRGGSVCPPTDCLLVRGLRRFLRVSEPLLYWAHCVSSFSTEADLKGPRSKTTKASVTSVSLPHGRQRWPVCFRSDIFGPDFQSNTVLFSDYDFCLISCQNRIGCFSLFSKTLLCTNLIISLREFLSNDITGLEGVTSVKKALNSGHQAPYLRPHSSTFPANQQQQFPVLLSPDFVFILADQKAKTVSVF